MGSWAALVVAATSPASFGIIRRGVVGPADRPPAGFAVWRGLVGLAPSGRTARPPLALCAREEVDPRHLTQWIKSAKDIDTLIELHAKHVSSFNHIHTSAAWIAISRHAHGRSKASASRSGYTRYRTLSKRLHDALGPLMYQSSAMARSGELAGRELANVMYGVARSRIPDGPQRSMLLDELAAAAVTRIRDLKPQARVASTCGRHTRSRGV